MRRKNMGLRRDSVGFFFFVSFCKCNDNDKYYYQSLVEDGFSVDGRACLY